MYDRYADDVGGRVVVLDERGTVVADSDGEDLGQEFATSGRPEVIEAFDSMPRSTRAMSLDEGGDIVVAAAPIIDEGQLVGVGQGLARRRAGPAQRTARHARDRHRGARPGSWRA